MSKNLTTRTTIENLAAELKNKFSAQASAISAAQTAADAGFKSVGITDSKISFYTNATKTGEPAAAIDLPADMVLDLAKTGMVDSFAWSETTYPGSTDPSLEGKPVLVMAVKADEGTNYSFLNMEKLVDVYTAAAGDGSATVTIDGFTVKVNVNISAEAGNQLQKKADGLYVPAPTPTDISGKADVVEGATAGNLAGLDADGNLTDSGLAATKMLTTDDISDYTAAEIAALLNGSEAGE